MRNSSVSLHAGPRVVKFDIGLSTQSVRFSLKTGDPDLGRLWTAQINAELEAVFASYRQKGVADLRAEQINALMGVMYRRWSVHPEKYNNMQAHFSRDTTKDYPLWERDAKGVPIANAIVEAPELDSVEHYWASNAGRAAFEQYALGLTGDSARTQGVPSDEEFFEMQVARPLLREHGIGEVTSFSMQRLVEGLILTWRHCMENVQRITSGNMGPDPRLANYVPFERAATQPYKPSAALGKLTVTGLLADWWAAAKANGASINTFINFTTHINQFVNWLGHDDARAVTTENVLDFKDYKLTTPSAKTKKPISARSFKSGALVALTSVFTWATNEKLLSSNPTAGIVFRVRKQARLRQRDFTEEEITAILKATLTVNPAANSRLYKRDLANKWIPWLCAYSGARVGEIAQLRKQDVKKAASGYYLNVTPEAGTVKTKEFREVPIHEHLVEMGFLAMVEHAKDGYLFIDPKGPEVVHTAIATRSARVRDFVRGAGVTDPNVQPNHGWRHTFKTICTGAGIEEKLQDAICGHAPRTEGGRYGTVPLRAKQEAMKLFPRYEV